MGPCPLRAHRFAHPSLADAHFGRILIAEIAAWIFAVGANCGPTVIARKAQSNDEANFLGIRSVNCERPVPSMNGRRIPLWHLCQRPIGTRAFSWGLRGGKTRLRPMRFRSARAPQPMKSHPWSVAVLGGRLRLRSVGAQQRRARTSHQRQSSRSNRRRASGGTLDGSLN